MGWLGFSAEKGETRVLDERDSKEGTSCTKYGSEACTVHVGSERTIDGVGPGASEEGASKVAEGRQARMGHLILEVQEVWGRPGSGSLTVNPRLLTKPQGLRTLLSRMLFYLRSPLLPHSLPVGLCSNVPLQRPSLATLHKTAPFVTVHPCTLLHSFSVWHFS